VRAGGDRREAFPQNERRGGSAAKRRKEAAPALGGQGKYRVFPSGREAIFLTYEEDENTIRKKKKGRDFADILGRREEKRLGASLSFDGEKRRFASPLKRRSRREVGEKKVCFLMRKKKRPRRENLVVSTESCKMGEDLGRVLPLGRRGFL